MFIPGMLSIVFGKKPNMSIVKIGKIFNIVFPLPTHWIIVSKSELIAIPISKVLLFL